MDPTVLRDRLDYAASQVDADRKGSIKNPAGYFISFVESDQLIPSGFQTRSRREVAAKRKVEEDALKAREREHTFAAMRLKEEYERWCQNEADAYVAREWSEELLARRLKLISSQLRRTENMAAALDRMTPSLRKAELMRELRKELVKEINLPSSEEWITDNQQGDLF